MRPIDQVEELCTYCRMSQELRLVKTGYYYCILTCLPIGEEDPCSTRHEAICIVARKKKEEEIVQKGDQQHV